MKLKDYFCHWRKVESITIRMKNQTFGFHAGVDECEITLLANDEVGLTISCISHSCTGSSGYDIGKIVAEALDSKDGHAKGRIDCNGREHTKPGALACTGRLYYEAQAIFV